MFTGQMELSSSKTSCTLSGIYRMNQWDVVISVKFFQYGKLLSAISPYPLSLQKNGISSQTSSCRYSWDWVKKLKAILVYLLRLPDHFTARPARFPVCPDLLGKDSPFWIKVLPDETWANPDGFHCRELGTLPMRLSRGSAVRVWSRCPSSQGCWRATKSYSFSDSSSSYEITMDYISHVLATLVLFELQHPWSTLGRTGTE